MNKNIRQQRFINNLAYKWNESKRKKKKERSCRETSQNHRLETEKNSGSYQSFMSGSRACFGFWLKIVNLDKWNCWLHWSNSSLHFTQKYKIPSLEILNPSIMFLSKNITSWAISQGEVLSSLGVVQWFFQDGLWEHSNKKKNKKGIVTEFIMQVLTWKFIEWSNTSQWTLYKPTSEMVIYIRPMGPDDDASGVQTSVLCSSSNLFGTFSITKFRPHQE